MHCLPWSVLFFTLEYSTFSKLIFLFQLQSFSFFVCVSLSISQHSIENVWNFFRLCVYVCEWVVSTHSGSSKSIPAYTTSSCRNFEEIDFFRLIYSLEGWDRLWFCWPHSCMFTVQAVEEPRQNEWKENKTKHFHLLTSRFIQDICVCVFCVNKWMPDFFFSFL